jgi:hypothetical protein
MGNILFGFQRRLFFTQAQLLECLPKVEGSEQGMQNDAHTFASGLEN